MQAFENRSSCIAIRGGGEAKSRKKKKYVFGDSRGQSRARLEERKWEQLFDNPAQWSDNRASKKSPKDPDFVHIFTWEGLWIDSCCCPSWVALKLESLKGAKKKLSDEETLQLYSRISAPSISMILATLKASSNLEDLETGMEIHSRLDEHEESNQFVASALVYMYSSCGSIEIARSAFEKMERPDLVAWNAMIGGYARCGDGDRALDLFARMEECSGLEPDGRTYVAALNACASVAAKNSGRMAECLEKGRAIHSRLAKNRLDLEDTFVASGLIDMYTKCGSMEDARRVFDKVAVSSHADVVLWTSLIAGYVRAGEPGIALEFFSKMQDFGEVRPNSRTFVAALAACSSLSGLKREETRQEIDEESLEKGRAIHARITELGLETDRFISSSLVDFYRKCGSMADARAVFDKISPEERDLVSWTSLIIGYAQGGEEEIALDLFLRMEETGLQPNARALGAALAACSTSAASDREADGKKTTKVLEIGMQLHARAARTNDLDDVYVASALLDTYSKCGSMIKASRVFDQMASHDVVSFTAMISGHARQVPAIALDLLSRMRSEGIAPNASTYIAGLQACSRLGALETGTRLYAGACKSGIGRDSNVACAAIDFYGKCGNMIDAKRVFEAVAGEMDATKNKNRKDPVLWSSLISGYSLNGDAERVFDLFVKMKEEKIKPDSITFLSILGACNHAGMVDRGTEVFRSMSSSEFGLIPGMEHYSCVVDMLGRANRVDEALALVKRMPREPSVEIWTALLDASRKCGHLEVAKIAFGAIEATKRENSASYSLMAVALLNSIQIT